MGEGTFYTPGLVLPLARAERGRGGQGVRECSNQNRAFKRIKDFLPDHLLLHEKRYDDDKSRKYGIMIMERR